MPKSKRVAIYCRVSTDKKDQLNSLSNQVEYFNKIINSDENYIIYKTYIDEGLSGTSIKKRTAFNQMIRDAYNDCFDLIFTKEVSRFARNTVDTLIFTRNLKERGIGVIFVSDNINTLDCDGELRLTIMSSIAQEESRKISQRIKWGQHIQMDKGFVFGNGTYGYNLTDGVITINKYESEIVKQIFEMFLTQKKSTYKIAKELTYKGIKTSKGNDFSPASIRRILKNEKYTGDLTISKTITTDFLSHKREYNTDSHTIKNHHEAIISHDIFNKAKKLLTNCSRKKQSDKFWFSSKVIYKGTDYRYTTYYTDGRLYGLRCRYVKDSPLIKYSYLYNTVKNAVDNLIKTDLHAKKIIKSLYLQGMTDEEVFKIITDYITVNNDRELNISFDLHNPSLFI